MRSMPVRITRRDALARIAGLAALASAATGRGEDDKTERPPARIYVSVSARRGGVPPEMAGILAVDPKDGTWTRIAPEPFDAPRVSPDGRMILCRRVNPLEEQGLYVVDARGDGPPKRIAEGLILRMFWSPDGSQVVFEQRETSKIVRINADGSGRTELPIPGRETVLAWSRDGLWFATQSARDDEVALAVRPVYLMHPDGTGERRLLDGGEARVVHGFSRDGRDLLFTTYDVEEAGPLKFARLELIGLDGKDRRTFLESRGHEHPVQAAWSPDGKQLVVFYREDRVEAGEPLTIDKIIFHLEVVFADGKRPRRLDVLEGIPFRLGDWG
jgi:Tol biopolymer transport system component